MTFPKLPDWSIYAASVFALALASIASRENVDAPPAPPPPDEEEGVLVGPAAPFEESSVITVTPGPRAPVSGTAFAVSQLGVWITARHVVEGCGRAAVILGPRRALAAEHETYPDADVAVLRTEGGPTALPLAPDLPLREGRPGFIPGYPRGKAGEVAVRLIGTEILRPRARGAPPEMVLAWAETGRTMGMEGTLAGLSGAPVLDAKGRVVAVTVAESPRRGRIYSTAPATVPNRLNPLRRDEFAPGELITSQNYGRVADALRRDLRVAQVVCLNA